MFCPECGENNKDGSKFCMNCGTSLNDSADTHPRNQGNTSGAPVYDYSQPNYEEPRYEQAQGYSTAPFASRYETAAQGPGPFAYICTFCTPFLGPVIGLILYFQYKDTHRSQANSLLILAIVTFVLFYGVNVLQFVGF